MRYNGLPLTAKNEKEEVKIYLEGDGFFKKTTDKKTGEVSKIRLTTEEMQAEFMKYSCSADHTVVMSFLKKGR